MTRKEKTAYIERIAKKLAKSWTYLREDAIVGPMIFATSHALLAAAIPGSQKTKKSKAALDKQYAEAFPAIIRAIR